MYERIMADGPLPGKIGSISYHFARTPSSAGWGVGLKQRKSLEWPQNDSSTTIDIPTMIVSISIDSDVYQENDGACGILV